MTDSPDSPTRVALRKALVASREAADRVEGARASLRRAEAYLASLQDHHGTLVATQGRGLEAAAAELAAWASSATAGGMPPAVAEPDLAAEIADAARQLAPARKARDDLLARVDAARAALAAAREDAEAAAAAVLRECCDQMAARLRDARIAYRDLAAELRVAVDARPPRPVVSGRVVMPGAPTVGRQALDELALAATLADPSQEIRGVVLGGSPGAAQPEPAARPHDVAEWRAFLAALLSDPDASPPC